VNTLSFSFEPVPVIRHLIAAAAELNRITGDLTREEVEVKVARAIARIEWALDTLRGTEA